MANVGAAAAIAANMLSRQKPYMLIDGNWLREEVKAFALKYFGVEDIPEQWFRPYNNITKTFYFDALPNPKPSQSPEEAMAARSAREREHAHIARCPDTHVRSGEAFHRKKRGGLEQKGVDILLAIQAITFAYRGVTSSFIMVLGDLDFVPLIDELVSMGVSVELWHSHQTSEVLLRSADRTQMLETHHFMHFLAPLGLQYPHASRPEGLLQSPNFRSDGGNVASLREHSNGYELLVHDQNGTLLSFQHSRPETLMAIMEDVFGSNSVPL